MQEERIIIAGGLTQAEINKLKKKHGALRLITVLENDDETKAIHFWFKKPDMTIMSAVQSLAEKDPIAATQLFFRSCLVHGDKSYADDVDVFMSIQPHLEALIEEKKVIVKNF